MEHHDLPVRSLILLAGHSSRMGSPKYLLPMPANVSKTGDEAPLLLHTILLHWMFQVKHGSPFSRNVTLSVRADPQKSDVETLLALYRDTLPPDFGVDYVQDEHADAGPSEGLLAAWRRDGDAHWLVTGCDYPLITDGTLEELWERHRLGRRAVTCFVNAEGFNEPLLAVWSREALMRLNGVVEMRGRGVGPNSVLKMLDWEGGDEDYGGGFGRGVLKVRPGDERWLTSVDTKEEWYRVEQWLRCGLLPIDS